MTGRARTASAQALAIVVTMTACGQSQSPRPDALTPQHPTATQSAAATTASSSAVPGAPVRRSIAKPMPEPLAVVVRPVAGEGSALLVTEDAAHNISYVRRIDAAGTLSAVKVLRGRNAIGALDASPPLLLSSDGDAVYVEPFSGSTAPVRHQLRPDFALLLAGRAALVDQRDERPPEAATTKTKTKPAKGDPAKTPPKKQKRKKRRKPSKPNKPVKPTKQRVWLQLLDATGAAAGEPVDSGLMLQPPLPGMALASAIGTKTGARVIWYERKKSRREAGRRIQQARLRTAALDADGKVIAGSRKLLFEGDRGYGFIEGHRDPRLFGFGDRSILVGRFIEKSGRKVTTGWEVQSIKPWATLQPPREVVAVDPVRLAKGGSIGQPELQVLHQIWALAPRLVAGQPATDAGRVAWAGGRGFFLKDGKLHSVARSDGTSRLEPEPFVANRSRIHWGVVDNTGAGMALTGDGIVELRPDGTLAGHARPVPAALRVPQGRPVRIGASWWAKLPTGSGAAGAAVVRLLPSELPATSLAASAYEDASALIGGDSDGMFIALHAGSLAVWRLAADGSAQRLASYRSPIGPGFAAIRRKAGGGLVAGRSLQPPHRLLVLTIDGRGVLEGVTPSSLQLRADELPSWLRARPAGGALLTGMQRRSVSWHDDRGVEEAVAPWPTADSGAACIDGLPARLQWPSDKPGQLQPAGLVAATGSCVSGAVAQLADGNLRWFGSTVSGLQSRAELGILAAPASGPGVGSTGKTPPAASPTKPAATGATSCPPDMVAVGSELCVDRFESQLVDAATGVPLSPDYPTTPHLTQIVLKKWAAGRWRTGDLHARAMPLPPLLRVPSAAPKALARSRLGVTPSGYLTGYAAKASCKAAGKRLCTYYEWVKACRGEQNRKYPYGVDYQHRACNVYRYAHPAATLHGNAAVGHLDPRLNHVIERGKPLLRSTGTTPRCASRWGDDAIYDMVGNLDEWVAHKSGTFAGGFYSRSSRKGCESVISVHPQRYLDYSLGTRCCLDAP